LLAIGVAWLYAGLFWFARRVRRIRRDEALTSRDVVEIDYPNWMRRLVEGHVVVLAGSVGFLFVGLGVFVVVVLITR
jgi:hypothetical protein